MSGAGAPRVLVIGEALVDIVGTQDDGLIESRPGGAPLNVAVGLARLSIPTMLLPSYGADRHGDAIEQHLQHSGVHLASTPRSEHPTSVAHATLDAAGAATYRFELQWDLPAPTLPADLLAVHVGSLGTVLKPGAEVVRRMVVDVAPAGAAITYDPNVRPTTSPDHEAAWSQVRDWAALAHVVKLSADDAAYLSPATGLDDVIDVLLDAEQTRLIVVTQGAAGATLATRDHRIHVGAPAVDVVDTVGAGDSFMSALIAALADGQPCDLDAISDIGRQRLHDIGSWAATAAAITCARRGADPPRRDDVTARTRR